MKSKKISIITVCLNAKNTIQKTIDSVIMQSYDHYQLVIVDGASTDGTTELINKYAEMPNLTIISEKDTGLYNAMNKGIRLADGEYVLFLNSGDVFYNDQVLETIAKHLTADVVYGNVERILSDKKFIEKYDGKFTAMKLFLMGKMVCHQVLFIRTAIMKKYFFDESFTISADHDMLMKCYKNQHSMKFVDIVISSVDCVDGISAQVKNFDIIREETDRSLRTYFPIWYYLVKIPKEMVRWYKRNAIEK